MTSAPPKRRLGVALWRHLRLTESWLAVSGPSIGRTAVKERCRRGYPGTKGSPGGKLPAGNGALRSPALNASAACRKTETNQE
jgi:hypothetical protein